MTSVPARRTAPGARPSRRRDAHHRRHDGPLRRRPRHAVTLVTCTLGEQGEVIPPELALLAPGARRPARRLPGRGAGRRPARPSACADHRYLGGAGRWRDSGMVLAGHGVRAALPDRSCTRGLSRRRRRSPTRSTRSRRARGAAPAGRRQLRRRRRVRPPRPRPRPRHHCRRPSPGCRACEALRHGGRPGPARGRARRAGRRRRPAVPPARARRAAQRARTRRSTSRIDVPAPPRGAASPRCARTPRRSPCGRRRRGPSRSR